MDPVGVGALTTGVLAEVDAAGTVTTPAGVLRWRVRPADDWLDPREAAGVRATRPAAAPLTEVAVRVPGGDVVQHVYALGEHDGLVVVEVENASPHPVAVALAIDGGDPRALLAVPRRPGAVDDNGALVFPLPHRTVLRVALGNPAVDVRRLPDRSAVARAWDRVLDRGMRAELPAPLQHEVDAARADLLLAPVTADTFIDLEEWGFDNEALAMWPTLGIRARRAARRRVRGRPSLLAATRRALLVDDGCAIDCLPEFRPEWLGQSVAVHDAPTRRGLVSFAVRWHGARPALFWDAPPGSVVTARALDPAWAASEPRGEALLAEPPHALLAMGPQSTTGGVPVDAPEAFS